MRSDERALLDHLLRIDIPGAPELREQAQKAEVMLESEGRWNIDLHVPTDAPPARDIRGPVVSRAVSRGEGLDGVDVTLWVRGDFLDHIEIAWFDTEPEQIPRPSELTPPETF